MISYPPIPKPKPELTRPTNDAAALFVASKSLKDVASVLEVHPGHLKRWLYECPGHAGYVTFIIPKRSGGERTISVPPPSIQILQAKFKTILDHVYRPKTCVCGFVANRSIVDGARPHKKRAHWVLNCDIKDYYPSIHFGRVLGLFVALGVGPKAAAVWAQLVTANGVLPQGASTSPVVSNMIAKQLDGKMMELARRFHLTYTRYADDLTLSTTKRVFPPEIAVCTATGLVPANIELGPRLLQTIQAAGFVVNVRKTRLYCKAVRQEVTGLTVNEFVNVKRGFVRQIRAMIHAGRKFGLVEAGREYVLRYAPAGRVGPEVLKCRGFDLGCYFKNIVYGKLAFLRMVRGKSDKCYVNLCLQMAEIDPAPPSQVLEIKKMYEEFDVFICHASEDKAMVATPLYEALKTAGVVPFIDTVHITWGDSFVEKINHALSRAKLVVVVLSKISVDKAWPRKEICSALAREVEGKTKVLPLMVGNDEEIAQLLDRLPLLKDKVYEKWEGDPGIVAGKIKSLLP